MADSKGVECLTLSPAIDETYEFSAPRYFDFINGETEQEIENAQLWFETSLSYAPSPFMPRIKLGRSVKLDFLCDLKEETTIPQAETTTGNLGDVNFAPVETCSLPKLPEPIAKESQTEETHQEEERKMNKISLNQIDAANKSCEDNEAKQSVSVPSLSTINIQATKTEACTPKSQIVSAKQVPLPTSSKNPTTAKAIASLIKKKTSANKPRNQSPLSRAKSVKQQQQTTRRCPGTSTAAKNSVAVDIAQENQAIKRQKLEDGRPRQILNIKDRIFPHKSKIGCGEKKRELWTRKDSASPFMSMAEMVRKFQSKTREINVSHNRSLSYDDTASMIQKRPMLKLTRPKEPNLETAHRVRAVRVKTSAEIELEMLEKIPKFKAKPVNKKMLEFPSLPALPRSTPQLPEFKEFHLKTMERAKQHIEASSDLNSLCPIHQTKLKSEETSLHKLTEPRPPRLETSMRARPPMVKSSQELELEELEKVPKFKARPFNKKIFESKGDLGLFCNSKRQMTTPLEFHFATDKRIKPANDGLHDYLINSIDIFDKLSLYSEPRSDQQIPKITTPNPFHLHTEERGLEKEKKFADEIFKQQLEEERARIPKANPYPYTTDYPVIPPKPEPKECTKPETFQLASLVRHEEEMHRIAEERERLEKEEAQMRVFRAQPIMKSDPIPVPEKARKPLTEVQEFSLHVDHRSVDRAEFDKKMKEKEMMYKRYREEYETAKMMEEEHVVKQMRKTMVPHAKPVPNFDNPFLPQRSSKEPTKPKSPNLHVVRPKHKCASTGAAAAAATTTHHHHHMR